MKKEGFFIGEGLKLEYKIEGTGKDIIVVENGLGNTMYNWNWIIEALKEKATFITYHRAGYGKSESSNFNRNTEVIAKELNELLNHLSINERVLLLGHSFGGLCVLHYANMFPKRVNGVVLVDSTSHNFQKLFDIDTPYMLKELSNDKFCELFREIANMDKEEFLEKYPIELSKDELNLPKYMQEKIMEYCSNQKLFLTSAVEMENWHISSELIKRYSSFPDVPMRVIARDMETAVNNLKSNGVPEYEAILFEDVWRDLQIELSELSSKGKLIIAKECDHIIQVENPKYVIDAIDEIITCM